MHCSVYAFAFFCLVIVNGDDWCIHQPSLGKHVLKSNCPVVWNGDYCSIPTYSKRDSWGPMHQTALCINGARMLSIDGTDYLKSVGQLPIMYRGNASKQYRFFTIMDDAQLIIRRINITGGDVVVKDAGNPKKRTHGGAILVGGGATLIVSYSAFFNNKAHVGGAIVGVGDSKIVIAHAVFERNQASGTLKGPYNGGAIRVYKYSVLNVSHSVFHSNSADSEGGAIHTKGIFSLTSSSVLLNMAKRGGGIYCGDGKCDLFSSRIIGNTARKTGGGLTCHGNQNTRFGLMRCSISNSSILYNRADENGGGVYVDSYSLCRLMKSTTVAMNNSTRIGGVDGLYCVGQQHVISNASDNAYWDVPGCRDDGTVYTTLPPYPLSCPAGKYSAFMLSPDHYADAQVQEGKCKACPAGKYSALPNANACTFCNRGTYERITGSTSCSGTCPVGRKGSQIGGKSLDACLPCQAGAYGSDCTRMCPPGKYGVLAGRGTEEDACPALCPAGRYGSAIVTGANDVSTACPFVCPQGKYGRRRGALSEADACEPCYPSSTCKGNNTCAPGSSGEMCAVCQESPTKHYRVGLKCLPCPVNSYGQYFLIAGILIFSCILLYFALKKVRRRTASHTHGRVRKGAMLKRVSGNQQTVATIGILSSQSQTILLVLPLINVRGFDWPHIPQSVWEALTEFVQVLSVDLVSIFKSPECDYDLNMKEKYLLLLMVPLAVSLCLCVWFAFVQWKFSGFQKLVISDRVVAVGLHLMYINGFTMFVASIISPLSCRRSGGDGNLVALTSDPRILCSFEDEAYATMVTACVFALLLYVLGPLFFLARSVYGCQCNRQRGCATWVPYATEGSLAELEDAISKLSVSHSSSKMIEEATKKNRFMNRYGWLFSRYRPKMFFWEFVILTRKLGLVLAAGLLLPYPVVSLSIQAIVLFVALCVHLRYLPYDHGRNEDGDKHVTILGRNCGLCRPPKNVNDRLESVFLSGALFLVLGSLCIETIRVDLKLVERCQTPLAPCEQCVRTVLPLICHDDRFPFSEGNREPFCAQKTIPATGLTAQQFFVFMDIVLTVGLNFEQTCYEALKPLACNMMVFPCGRSCNLKRQLPCNWCTQVAQKCLEVEAIFNNIITRENNDEVFLLMKQTYADVLSPLEFASLGHDLIVKTGKLLFWQLRQSCNKTTCYKNVPSNVTVVFDDSIDTLDQRHFTSDTCMDRPVCNNTVLAYIPSHPSTSESPIIHLGDAANAYFPLQSSVAVAFHWMGMLFLLCGFVWLLAYIVYTWRGKIKQKKIQAVERDDTQPSLRRNRSKGRIVHALRREDMASNIQRVWRKWQKQNSVYRALSYKERIRLRIQECYDKVPLTMHKSNKRGLGIELRPDNRSDFVVIHRCGVLMSGFRFGLREGDVLVKFGDHDISHDLDFNRVVAETWGAAAENTTIRCLVLRNIAKQLHKNRLPGNAGRAHVIEKVVADEGLDAYYINPLFKTSSA